MILSEAKKILNKNGYQLVESKSDEQLSLLKKLLDENDIDYDDWQDAGSIYVTRMPTNDVEITYNTNPRYSDGVGFMSLLKMVMNGNLIQLKKF